MPRSRELKYSFFTDEEIGALTPLARLLFEGLWCLADCDGRLEDRPARIKVMVLPFDNCDCDALLTELATAHGNFIQRYEVDGKRYIQVRTLKKNQHFHPKEKAAGFPPPPAGKIPGKPETLTASTGHFQASPAIPSSPSLPSEISKPTDPPKAPQGGQGELRLVPDDGQAAGTEADAIRAVFAHYRTHHPRACPDPKSTGTEWRKIKARLSEGSTVDDLCKAIDGYHRHQWHVENGQLGLELIVRDASHVTQGIGWASSTVATQESRHGFARAEDQKFTQTGKVQI